MPNINIALPRVPNVGRNFTYSDLHLDFAVSNLVTDEVHKNVQQHDVVADYDLGAIRNSIINLFTTSPGDKILNPTFGIDLRYFLFYPVSPTIAFSIKDAIEQGITTQEPRVSLNSLDVIPDEDNQQYVINMSLGVPFLQINEFILNSYLNSQGYVTFA